MMMATAKKKTTTSQPLSRYERVKNILNAAQGKVDVSYQGYGRFWELPLDKFLAAEIYGVRLIAPDSDDAPDADNACGCKSCDCQSDSGSCNCGESCNCNDGGEASSCCSETSASTPRRCPGRGAASGLIKGLRGEAPFDGSQFPPLLWGPSATPVTADDIQFIQDWIDDCCPETDEQATVLEGAHTQRKNLAYGHAAHTLTSQPLNVHKGTSGQLKVRKNIESLTPDELARFRAAVAKMQSYDQYPQDERSFAYWARMHPDMCQHGWEQFLTWHRAYLYFFEQRLQDIDPSVTLPYWDWAQYAKQNQAAASQNPPPPKTPQPNGQKQFSHDSGVIPEQYGCWMDGSGLANLRDKIDPDTWTKLDRIKGEVYLSGNRLYIAAGITYQGAAAPGSAPTQDDLIMNELQRINPLWHRQRWAGMNAALISHYPTPEDIGRILQTPDFAHWGGGPPSDHFFGAVESVHNFMHNFAGGLNPNYIVGDNPELYTEPQFGHMVEARVTAYDPIFWAHHSNVDRLYAQWQEMHPGVNPQVLNSPLAPFEMVVSDALTTHDLGYEYVQDAFYFPTDNTQGLVRFHSEELAVPRQVLQNHRRVEVRLHKVQVAQRGANIRVFISQPDADAETPIAGNDHYVGNFTTFVGFCYGGPGHCAVPPETQRPFDQRMRHHKTPGNLRFDITAAVYKLLNGHQGAYLPLSVDLVVTDLQGQTREDLLKLDGVSINFIH